MQIEDRTKCTHTYTHYTEAHIFLFNDVSVPCADEVWGDVREKKTIFHLALQPYRNKYMCPTSLFHGRNRKS